MIRKEILFSWQRWIASVALASTLLITGCATNGTRVSWRPWGGDGSVVVDSMNSMKNATSRMAEFARLKKKSPETIEEDRVGRSKVDTLRLQEETTSKEQQSLGETFAALVQRNPDKKPAFNDPFHEETTQKETTDQKIVQTTQKEAEPSEAPLPPWATETANTNSETTVKRNDDPLIEQRFNPFVDVAPRSSSIERLQEKIQNEESNSVEKKIDTNREDVYRLQVTELMSSARRLMKRGEMKQALLSATRAKNISATQSLFYGPNGDDPVLLVQQINEEIASSQWSTSEPVITPRKTAATEDPFLPGDVVPAKRGFTIDSDQSSNLTENVAEKESSSISFSPSPEMVIESESVLSRSEARESHRVERIQKKSNTIEIENSETSSGLVFPTLPQDDTPQLLDNQPVIRSERENNASADLMRNPFLGRNDSSHTEMPVLGFGPGLNEPSEKAPLLAPPPPTERLTDEDFLSEIEKTNGPSFLFSGEQIAMNEQQATDLNASSEISLAPLPVEIPMVADVDGGVFTLWKSPKMLGLAVVVLLLLGFIAWKKTAPSIAEEK